MMSFYVTVITNQWRYSRFGTHKKIKIVNFRRCVSGDDIFKVIAAFFLKARPFTNLHNLRLIRMVGNCALASNIKESSVCFNELRPNVM